MEERLAALNLLRESNHLPRELELMAVRKLRDDFSAAGKPLDALPHAQRAAEFAPVINDRVDVILLANMLRDCQRFEESKAILDEELTRAETAEQQELYGIILMHLGQWCYAQGKHRDEFDWYTKSYHVLKRFKDEAAYGVLMAEMSVCCMHLGDWKGAIFAHKEALKSIEHGSLEAAQHLVSISRAYCQMKRFRDAKKIAQEAQKIFIAKLGRDHLLSRELAEDLDAIEAGIKNPKATHVAYNVCNACRRVPGANKPYQVCSVCKEVKYCSAECQKQDWPAHKKVCKKP